MKFNGSTSPEHKKLEQMTSKRLVIHKNLNVYLTNQKSLFRD